MNRCKTYGLALLLGVLAACSSTPAPAAADPNLFTEKNAWKADIPADAQVVSPDEFRNRVASGELAVVSSADLDGQKSSREQQYQQDQSFLGSLSAKSPDVLSLLAEAASHPAYEGDRHVKAAGQTVSVFGLGTQLHLAADAERRAQSVDNALADYRVSFELLTDDLKAKAPSPDSLQGKPLAEVKAALESINTLLATQPSPVRPEPNGAAFRPQAVSPGNGSDQESACTAPSNLVRRYWFPLKNFVSPVKKQAGRGVCWAFAAIGAVESRERVQQNNAADLSEQFLVNKVKQDWDANDYAEGYWSEKALDAAASKGQQLPNEAGWTYNPSNSRGAGNDDDAASFGGSCTNYTGTCSDTAHQSRRVCTTIVFKFCSYVKVTFGGPGVASSKTVQIWKNGDSFDLNRYRLLLNQGHVILASLRLYRGFMDDVKSDGVVSNYSETMFDAKGKEVSGSYGGHAVQIVGFLSNDDLTSFGNTPKIGGGGYFIIKNSWGCGAGDGGYYYVPADYVQKFFKVLSILDFDKGRSDAWNREQANPGSTQAPGIQVKVNPARVDLRVETDLAQFFKVSHSVAKAVTLTVTSDRDGTVYNGPWSTDTNVIAGPSLKYTFGSAGARTLTLRASYAGNQAQASFGVNVVNTPPSLSLKTSGDPHQGEDYQVTAVITDPNEPDPSTLCPATTWAVDAPDVLSATTGCTVTVKFGATGSRQLRVSTADREGAPGTQTLTLSVLPPSVNPYPKITDAGVFQCGGPRVGNGATVDLTSPNCNRYPYSAQVTVDNPGSENLTYQWAILITDNQGEHPLVRSGASASPTFQMYTPYNAGPGTDPCRVTVTVNAPDPSRSKSQTVWSGNCRHYSFQLN